MSVINNFDLYNKLHELSQKSTQDTSPSNDFRVCFMTASRINYPVLAEINLEFEKNVMFAKKFQKMFLSNMFIL